MEPADMIQLGCVVLYTLIAAATDLRARKIPNVLTVTAFGSGLLFHLVLGGVRGGWAGVLGSWDGGGLIFALAGFATGFGPLFVLWLIGGGAGGDTKYMGALGAWLGASLTLRVFVVGTVFVVLGGVGALVYQTLRLGVSGVRRQYMRKGSSRSRGGASTPARRRLIPFGVPVGLATWLVLAVDKWQ